MPIKFQCRHCGKSLKTPDGSTGKKCKCPKCGELMTVPAESESTSQGGFGASSGFEAGYGEASPPESGYGATPTSQPGNSPQYNPTQGNQYGQAGFGSQPGQQQAQPYNPYSAPTQNVAPGYSSGMKNHRGALTLTLGIISTVISLMSCCCIYILPFCALGTGIPAWLMGSADIKAIDARTMDPSGRGLAMAGMILGIIGTILGGLGALFMVGMVVLAIIGEM